MNRAGIVIALLFAMLWQSIALARAGSTVEAVSDPAHAVLHWQDEGHHHHDDGSHHFDDSDDSVQHLFVDHVTAPVALCMPSRHRWPRSGPARRVRYA